MDPKELPTSSVQRAAAPKETKKADVVFDTILNFGWKTKFYQEIRTIPVDEIMVNFESCLVGGDRRGVTAVLRMMDEQLQVREQIDGPKKAFALGLASALILVAFSRVASAGDVILILAAALMIIAAANGWHAWEARTLSRAYAEERRQILRKAAGVIEELVTGGHLPRKLYSDDRRRLEKLSAGAAGFKPVKRQILRAVEW